MTQPYSARRAARDRLAAVEQLSAAMTLVPPDHPAAIVVAEAIGGCLDDSRPLAGAIPEIADSLVAYAEKIPPPPPEVTALAELLDALLRDDPVALRTALDANAGRTSPRLCAILGAVHLRLADDLDTAIALLSDAARNLDEDGLHTRTWWRLAEAYRARGATGDADLSRSAGLHSLHGPDTDRRDAARFAGWMLAEGRGEEAFTALEIAAAASEPPIADPLVLDVLSVLVGVAPKPSPPPTPPSPASVAAAVREIGAAALLYLHPTDDAGRIVGVLCLDPTTDRLEVLANLPVTDPLATDDPGWPAILRRWTSENLLVAATGGLGRLALSAVRTGDGRYLAQDVVVSYVSSGFQVLRLAARRSVPVDTEPLFVVNPRGDRDSEVAEVMAVRRVFYPRSVCLGRALEPVDGAGTRADLLARLPAASLLHLACGVRGTELQLAGHDVLDVAAVHSAAGLVILSEHSAPALLDAGFAGVVGWLWAVPAPFGSLALFLLHLQLVAHRRQPAAAVNAVQRWMLDPDRELPPCLTGAHLSTATTTDLTRPALWAALAYHGR